MTPGGTGPRPAASTALVTLSRLFRVLVAVLLTAYVLYQADPAAVVGAARDADLGWIAAAIGLVLVDRALMAVRWLDLLAALTPGSRPGLASILRIFFVSSFVSNFVPSVAADLYRAYALARHDVRLSESTASVLMDRLLGVLSMVTVGVLALPLAPQGAVREGMAAGLAIAAAGCVAGAWVVFSERAVGLVRRLAGWIPVERVRRIAVALTEAVQRYSRHRRALVRVLAVSVLVQAIRVTQCWCLGRALGVEATLLTYFALVPIVLVIMQLPVTVNGLGTTQWAFVTLFAPSGVGAPEAFAISVLFLALGVIGSLPGGLLYALAPAGAVTPPPPLAPADGAQPRR